MDKISTVTSPIYYVNDNPHIGHAYTSIAVDFLARLSRFLEYQTFFLTGTDEHGQKIQVAAEKKGISPQQHCNDVSQNFQLLTSLFCLSNDAFIRTTQPHHIKGVQHLWKVLQAKGDIYKGVYTGWYAVADEAFYTEEETVVVEGGQRLSSSGRPVKWLEEESYFFRLSAYTDDLLAFYHANPEFILPRGRYNEVVSFVKKGLKDLSISRTSCQWGIPVPGDKRHVMYVWLDALSNYITALGYPDTGTPQFQTFWSHAVHVVGKDILRFHAVYWPAFLLAAELPMPKRIFAHGWWTVEGEKMSKSAGNFLSAQQMVQTYGTDEIRYFLLRHLPFGSDGDFSEEAVKTRTKADLANDFGNLIQRVFSMIMDNCQQQCPSPAPLKQEDTQLFANIKILLNKMEKRLEKQEISEALKEIWAGISEANKYIAMQQPWALKTSDPLRMKTVLWVALELCRQLALLVSPVIPIAADKVLKALGRAQAPLTKTQLLHHPLKAGHPISLPPVLFPLGGRTPRATPRT